MLPSPQMMPAAQAMGRPRQSISHAVMVDLGAPRMGWYRNMMLTIIAQTKKALDSTPSQHLCDTCFERKHTCQLPTHMLK